MKRILILHELVLPSAPQDVQDVLVQAEAVANACAELGFSAAMVPVISNLQGLKKTLLEEKPDIVFNLVESLDSQTSLIHLVPAMLESMKILFTGSGSKAMINTTDKVITKRILAQKGINTPLWQKMIDVMGIDFSFAYPCIIKPIAEDGSCGITDTSVCYNELQVMNFLNNLSEEERGRYFIEQYIEGREFNVGIIEEKNGFKALPAAEIKFLNFPKGKPCILNYESKWNDSTFEYGHTVRTFDFGAEDRRLIDEMVEIAFQCGQMLDLSGYARVDFRVDKNNKPWVLEVNANPCISPDSGFVAMAKESGYSYPAMIKQIIQSA